MKIKIEDEIEKARMPVRASLRNCSYLSPTPEDAARCGERSLKTTVQDFSSTHFSDTAGDAAKSRLILGTALLAL
jgi:hypothetical protein